MMAVPPFGSPAKISAFAIAISVSVAKNSRCADATQVTMAMCGRTNCVSSASSPLWFMPISNTPKREDAGIRASDRGTPVWLL